MEQYTNTEIVRIAKIHKAVIWLILASLILYIGVLSFLSQLPFADSVITLIITIIFLVFGYQLAKALKLRNAWAWCLGLIVPLLGLILLLALSSKAITVIKSKGVPVGFMGASKAQLAKLAATS